MIEFQPAEDEWDDTEWLQVAAHHATFAFLGDADEDIYTLSDGQPIQDEYPKGEMNASSTVVCERSHR